MFSERSDRPPEEPRRRHELDLSPRCDAPSFAPHEGHARVAGALRALGARIVPERIVLVPSAPAAYLGLLYVLADPGDEVLVTAPGDPRLAELAAISGVGASALPLRLVDERWTLDAETLFEAAGERTRAVLLASPGVPTGHRVPDELIDVLAELALPIVCDERLATLGIESAPRSILAHPIFETEHAPLALVIGEHWLAVAGPADRAEPVLTRLERIAGSFFASPAAAAPVTTASPRAVENIALIRRALAGSRCEVPQVDGGLCACVRLPHTRTADEWTRSLDARGVTVESGARYDFHEGAWIVLSLDVDTDVLARGLAVLRELVDAP